MHLKHQNHPHYLTQVNYQFSMIEAHKSTRNRYMITSNSPKSRLLFGSPPSVAASSAPTTPRQSSSDARHSHDHTHKDNPSYSKGINLFNSPPCRRSSLTPLPSSQPHSTSSLRTKLPISGLTSTLAHLWGWSPEVSESTTEGGEKDRGGLSEERRAMAEGGREETASTSEMRALEPFSHQHCSQPIGVKMHSADSMQERQAVRGSIVGHSPEKVDSNSDIGVRANLVDLPHQTQQQGAVSETSNRKTRIASVGQGEGKNQKLFLEPLNETVDLSPKFPLRGRRRTSYKDKRPPPILHPDLVGYRFDHHGEAPETLEAYNDPPNAPGFKHIPCDNYGANDAFSLTRLIASAGLIPSRARRSGPFNIQIISCLSTSININTPHCRTKPVTKAQGVPPSLVPPPAVALPHPTEVITYIRLTLGCINLTPTHSTPSPTSFPAYP
eukprot:GHVN01085009.1.p2 GENE.GHVN01085009.1~~GHVN01085009.1.p2  ORF type:complete len:441 (-),score=98.15 GHVN01085009.1:1233-2555(-)